MTSQGRPGASFVERVSLFSVGALLGGLAVWGALYFWGPPPQPDDDERPPIIVRNGSVLVEVSGSADQGEFKKEPGKRIWYHDHPNKGPKRLNAFVVGVANSSCGSAGAYLRLNVHRLAVTYAVGDATKVIDIKLGPKRIDVDLDNQPGTPDPDTSVNSWTLKFDQASATMTEVVLNGPGGPPVTCRLDAGAMITITQQQ